MIYLCAGRNWKACSSFYRTAKCSITIGFLQFIQRICCNKLQLALSECLGVGHDNSNSVIQCNVQVLYGFFLTLCGNLEDQFIL